MTNETIIMNESFKLMESGILSGSGRYGIMTDENGNEKKVELPEEIHTFAAWKERGYIVKRGQHAIASFHIWKYAASSRRNQPEESSADGETEEENGRCFLKLSFFFKRDQVEKITA